MPSITTILQQQLPQIVENFTSSIIEPSHKIEKYRETLGERQTYYFNFQRGNDLRNKCLVAIDGGSTSQMLAGGDLIVVGATMAESPLGKIQLLREEIPAEAYAGIVSHTGENQKVKETMMAALELRVLQQTKADAKIIDGSYLGNTTTVLYGLTGPAYTARILLDYEQQHNDGLLLDAINGLLLPKRMPETDVVAVVKSDSSFEFARNALGEDTSISDRIFASRFLHPGEYLNPRPLISSRRIINAYKKIDFTAQAKKIGKDYSELFYALTEHKDQMLRSLDNSKEAEKSLLWTTYFKPSKWSDYSPVIRIEFPHHVTKGYSAIDRAAELIALLDQDIQSQIMLEPMSQYTADRNAKDVSFATDMIKSMLASSAGTARDAVSLLRGYRT